MAEWSTTTKHEPSSINGGRKYEDRDRISIEQLNNMTENAFYAMAKSDEAKAESASAKQVADEALAQAQTTGTRVLVDGSFVTEFNSDTKVDKEEGKGLSTNDFTNEDKNKLDGLSNYTAGNGISIENGAISSNVVIDTLYNQDATSLTSKTVTINNLQEYKCFWVKYRVYGGDNLYDYTPLYKVENIQIQHNIYGYDGRNYLSITVNGNNITLNCGNSARAVPVAIYGIK